MTTRLASVSRSSIHLCRHTCRYRGPGCIAGHQPNCRRRDGSPGAPANRAAASGEAAGGPRRRRGYGVRTTTGKLLVEDLRPSAFIFSRFPGVALDQTNQARVRHRARPDRRGPRRTVDGAHRHRGVARNDCPRSTARNVSARTARAFTLLKFRSMRNDAEQGTPIWAKTEDGRVTPVGRFIRSCAAPNCRNCGTCSAAT